MITTSFWYILTWFFISICFVRAGLRQLGAEYEGIALVLVGCVALALSTIGIIKRIMDDINEFKR